MKKPLSDYPFMKLYLASFMSDCIGKTELEIGQMVLKTMTSWVENDYDSLPNWAKKAADERFGKSATNSENRKKALHIVEENQPSSTTVNNGKQSPISSPLISSSLSFNKDIKEGKVRPKKEFVPPTKEEVIKYCNESGYACIGEKAFNYYNAANWKDRNGDQVKNWKQKLIGVWFKEENKSKPNFELTPEQIMMKKLQAAL